MPSASSLSPLLALGSVTLLLGVIYVVRWSIDRRKLPDGPPSLPLIGNLHQIPKAGAHRQFTAWARQYGGIFALKLGPATAIVLTDRRLVKELVDKKSGIYSDRPRSYVSHDLITRGDHLLVMNHGNTWRSLRKMIHQHFMESMCEKHHLELQDAEAVKMLRDFCVAPNQHMVHPKRFSNSIIMSILFGIRTASYEAAHLVQLYDMMERWSKVMEIGATPPVDIFPVLKMVPEWLLGNWVSRSRDVGKRMDALYDALQARVVNRRRQGIYKDTFIDKVLDQNEKLGYHHNQVNFLGGVLLEGGSDTTSTMILVCIQAMILNPLVQKRAQEDLDAVCGEERSPQWSDYKHLPYISMIVKETMRWRPVTPLAFPHALAEDDWVDGRFVPKGTTVLLNVWGLHHDEAVFPNPQAFDPDRYEGRTQLAAEYAASPDYANRDHYIYGSGRRICPGIHLAERNMFLGVAKLLWAFSFEQRLDAQGRAIPIDIDPTTGYTEGFLVCPKPFKCRIIPRSKVKEKTIMREFAKADTCIFRDFQV